MASGEITVTGIGETRIELLGKPRHVSVRFEEEHHIPCNHHHHHDTLSHFVDHEDEDPRRHNDIIHQHQDRKWVLVITWQVTDIRVIHWHVMY